MKLSDIITPVARNMPETENVRVAQLDRASDYGSEGRGFKSFLVQVKNPPIITRIVGVFILCNNKVKLPNMW